MNHNFLRIKNDMIYLRFLYKSHDFIKRIARESTRI